MTYLRSYKWLCDGLMGIVLRTGVLSGLIWLTIHAGMIGGEAAEGRMALEKDKGFVKKINFVSTNGKGRTTNPVGWEPYEGSVYNPERGYGWLADLSGGGWDGGGFGEMILANGTRASPRELGRLELANWQGTHQENLPVVFRIDLPDGWYRVTCTSVDPDNAPLPLVDQRSIKCRAHDVVFAGPQYGPPLKDEGNRLVAGTAIVEVTEGHVRIVVGDPAYGGWIWSYQGPWYRGWLSWLGRKNHQRYAGNWYQKLIRMVDPGFHSLRLNSLEIERVEPPTTRSSLFFRDFFNRDDSPDVNSGVPAAEHWDAIPLDSSHPGKMRTDLYKTSIRITGPKSVSGIVGLVQPKVSPPSGVVRYSTRVSLFTGEGSKIHSGVQEAGLLILAEPGVATEFTSTFIGVAFDPSRSETPGWIKFRVGNGLDGYRTNLEIPDTSLPFTITEGEYEIIVDHDVENNVLKLIQINGAAITDLFAASSRAQRISRGLYGIRATMNPLDSGVKLQQFYWYYRVEDVSREGVLVRQ